VKTAFVALDADTPPTPLPPKGGVGKHSIIFISSIHIFSLFNSPFRGLGGCKKNPGLLGRDRILICFRFLCFGKYYPASFFKEVIKEKIKSICDDCFHSESNIDCRKFFKKYY
jgi:hypothetical protein